MTTPPHLFSSARRRASRDRMAAMAAIDNVGNFVAPLIRESLLERLAIVQRTFDKTLLIGAHDEQLISALREQTTALTIVEAGAIFAERSHAHQLDSEQFARAAQVDMPADLVHLKDVDLIVWAGGLESIDDVPNTMRGLRACLGRGGLMIGALIGDGSFPLLRRLLTSESLRAIPRMHPQISLRSMGDVLHHCGFALPVVDVESYSLAYKHWRDIVRDLRASGLAGQLASAPPPLRRSEIAALDRAFQSHMRESHTAPDSPQASEAIETLRIIHFHGWAQDSKTPHPKPPLTAR